MLRNVTLSSNYCNTTQCIDIKSSAPIIIQVSQYTDQGEHDKARKTLLAARIMVAVGVVAGIIIVALAITLKVLSLENSQGSSENDN